MASTRKDEETIQNASAWLFKNGYGVVERPIYLPKESKKNETIVLENPPEGPVHGTFWVVASNDLTTVHNVTTQDVTKDVEHTCLSIPELLLANVGKKLDLYVLEPTGLSTEPKEKIVKHSGVLKDIPRSKSNSKAPEPAPSEGLLLLEEESGVLAILIQSVQSVHLAADEVKRGVQFSTAYKKKVNENTLLICYSKEAGESELRVRYLTFQITWAPSYYIRLFENPIKVEKVEKSEKGKKEEKTVEKLEKRCIFSLKAVALNDAESLDCKNLSFITGFPNIGFQSVTDPMGKKRQSLVDFLASLESGQNNPPVIAPVKRQQRRSSNNRRDNSNIMSNVMVQSYMPPSSSDPSSDDDTTPPPALDDLYIYTVSNIPLPSRERTYIPIFDLELSYMDVYSADLNTNENLQEVWHSIRIKNTTSSPWTTAPVMISKGDMFLAQDINNLTPPGEESLINFTKAYSIKVLLEEKSEGSKNKINIFSYSYTIYTTKGTISITNFKNEEAMVVLKRFMVGELQKSSIQPKSNIEKPRVDLANTQRTITWEVTVPAGKSITIEYTYVVNRRY